VSKTATIQTRIEPELKERSKALFASLGLSTSDAITIFLHQAILRNGLPFDVKIPNAETLASFEEAKNPDGLKSYSDVKEALDDMWGND